MRWSEHDQEMVRAWSGNGHEMVKWQRDGKEMFRDGRKITRKLSGDTRWSGTGKEMIRRWSGDGQEMVRRWSGDGQGMIRRWSEHGQEIEG